MSQKRDGESPQEYGSDILLDALEAFGFRDIVLNPGATLRGFCESLERRPQMSTILALHEMIAVSTGEGYGRATNRPTVVMLHDLVGLLNGSLAMFNAWANQVPILVIGGTAPHDQLTRRPWIDWVHGTGDHGAVNRQYTVWDDEPGSLESAITSFWRAIQQATIIGHGPAYIGIDVTLQEEVVEPARAAVLREQIRRTVAKPLAVATDTVPLQVTDHVLDLIAQSQRPVVVTDCATRTREDFDALSNFVRALGCPAFDLGARYNLPSDLVLPRSARADTLAQADLVLCVGLRDPAYGLGVADLEHHGNILLVSPATPVVALGRHSWASNGSVDVSGVYLPAQEIIAEPRPVLEQLVASMRNAPEKYRRAWTPSDTSENEPAGGEGSIAHIVRAKLRGLRYVVANGAGKGDPDQLLSSSWGTRHLGVNLGGGLGHGFGSAIGAALALRGEVDLILNFQSDGDLLYTPSALWTAARYELPILTIVLNNAGYAQDRKHAVVMGKTRAPIGVGLSATYEVVQPTVNFAGLAESFGVPSWGPVTTAEQLDHSLDAALSVISGQRRPALIDLVVPGTGVPGHFDE